VLFVEKGAGEEGAPRATTATSSTRALCVCGLAEKKTVTASKAALRPITTTSQPYKFFL
jgi:hypothetical protein